MRFVASSGLIKPRYINYSSLHLRDWLASKVRLLLKQQPVNQTPNNPLESYVYYLERFRFTHLMLSELKTYYPKQAAVQDGSVYHPVLFDITSIDTARLRLEAACCAWLSWDGKTLKDVGVPVDQIPDGLSYGLVLRYPEPIMRAACYLAEETKEEELLYRITPEKHYQAEQFALQELRRSFALTETQIDNILSGHRQHSLAVRPLP